MDNVFQYEQVKHLIDAIPIIRCKNCAMEMKIPPVSVDDAAGCCVAMVRGYEHDGGYLLGNKKYWLYLTCRCGYQTSFVKLGIKRED